MKPIKSAVDFLTPNWNALKFIEAQQNPNFGEILNWLIEGENSLKSQLTSIIHDHYTEFVSISKQLIRLGEYNNSIITQLESSEENLIKSTENLKNSTQGIIPLKEKYRNLEKEILNTQIADETLTLLHSASHHLENKDIYSMLDCAIELSLAKTTLRKLDQPALVNPISKGLKTISSQFTNSLSEVFIRSINDQHKEDLSIISNAIILSGNISLIYESFSNNFINPLIKTITLPSATEPNSNEILSSLVDFLLKDNNPIQFANDNTPSCFDFMYGSFWPKISSYLKDKIIFPLIPIGAIKSSYDFWRQFQDVCEKFCKSKNAVSFIRNSKETKIIEEKMLLEVYVQRITSQIYDKANDYFSNLSNLNANDMANFFLELCASFFSKEKFINEMARNFCSSYRTLIYSLCSRSKSANFQQLPFYYSCLKLVKTKVTLILPEFCSKVGELAEIEIQKCMNEIEDKLIEELSNQCSEAVRTCIMVISGQKSKIPSSYVKEIFKKYRDWSKQMEQNNLDIGSKDFFRRIFENTMEFFYKEAEKSIEAEKTRRATIQMWHDANQQSNEESKDETSSYRETLRMNFNEFLRPALQMSINFENMESYQKIIQLLQ